MDFAKIVIDRVVRAFSLKRKKGETKRIRHRNNKGMILCVSGEISYFINECKYVQNEGQAIFIPDGLTYYLECKEDAECYIIDFDECGSLIKEPILIDVGAKKSVIGLVRTLCGLFVSQNNSSRLKSLSVFYDILYKISFCAGFSGKARKKFEIIRPSVEYLEENCLSVDIRNETLANISNVSVVYFRKIFRELFNTSPMRYMLMLKVDKAKELLVIDEMTITEISDYCGFKDVYNFSRIFKRVVGVSPANYRRECC